MRSGVQSCLPKEALRPGHCRQALERLRALGLSLHPGTKPSIRSALLVASMGKDHVHTNSRTRIPGNDWARNVTLVSRKGHTRETQIRKDPWHS